MCTPSLLAGPGDIVLVSGIENIGIGVTLTDQLKTRCPLPMLLVDEPTLTMNFCVNNFATRRSRGQVRDEPPDPRPAADRELQSNVALRVQASTERGRHLRGQRAAANCT